MVTTFFLDTSIIIDYVKGKEDAQKIFKELYGNLTSSYICLAELLEGAYRSRNTVDIKNESMALFSRLDNIFGIDMQTAEEFGKIKALLSKKGELIGDIDTLIAATCIAHDLTLITQNKKHFSRIKKLKLFKS